MSATTAMRPESGLRPTFPRLVRAEWIKLRSLRSTLWTSIATILIMTAFGALFAWAMTTFPESPSRDVSSAIVGYPIAQLTIAVLGALIITGEFTTGAYRSTLAAEPRRLRVVGAKGLIVLLTGLVVGTLAVAAAIGAAVPILLGAGGSVEVPAEALEAIIGTVLYLTVSALFAYGIGLIVRNSAGAITATVGVLFVLPVIVQIAAAMTNADWLWKTYEYLPSTAGSAITGFGMGGASSLEPWAGFAVFCGYTVVALLIGAFSFARRDD